MMISPKIFKRMFNIPNYPETLKNNKEPILLHISDIPVSYYPFVYRVIQELEPRYLIHTGDLADNIKLENNPQLIDFYITRITPFIHTIEAYPIKEIFLIPGNHDHLPAIQRACGRTQILEEGETILIEDVLINIAHYPWHLSGKANYYLYGHNFDEIPDSQDAIYLNGLNRINIILLHSKKVLHMDYPYGINQDRKMTSNKYF